jgi:hypothetical protein
MNITLDRTNEALHRLIIVNYVLYTDFGVHPLLPSGTNVKVHDMNPVRLRRGPNFHEQQGYFDLLYDVNRLS